MTLFRRQSVTAGFGTVLIAALAVCPMIGTVPDGWSASICHTGDDREAPARSSFSIVCCAVEVLAVSPAAARGDQPPSPDRRERFATAVVAPLLQRAERYSRSHQPHPASPPLFLHHVSLLI